ncbi:hypothetical protein [Streptomyces sp. YGL11-2]|uniref:hypothetical protein n=1 Tax=Streptomyces sp. YGL11-2 TaxID=3414028 RepID=UPI003CFAF8CA
MASSVPPRGGGTRENCRCPPSRWGGNCLHFAFGRSGPAGDTLTSFTGLLRAGVLETLWHVIADSAVKPPRPGATPELRTLPWPHAAMTNADTFRRVRP